jgi:hypothetical protein
MVNLILSLALTLPAQAAPELKNPRPAEAQRPADLNARRPDEPRQAAPARRPAKPEAVRRTDIQVTVDRRRARSVARAGAARQAQAQAATLYKAELDYQARIAPFVAQQQQRAAEIDARAASDQAWRAIARERNLVYAYGLGAPITTGSGGVQVYGGLPGVGGP